MGSSSEANECKKHRVIHCGAMVGLLSEVRKARQSTGLAVVVVGGETDISSAWVVSVLEKGWAAHE